MTNAIRDLDLFKGLGKEAQARLPDLLKSRAAVAGAVLFHQDDAGAEAFVILSGAVRIERIHPHGDRVLLAILGPGDIFGEMALITGNPRMAQAVAHLDSQLLALHKKNFNELMALDSNVNAHLMRALSHRLLRADLQIEQARSDSLSSRLAEVILTLLERFGVAKGNKSALTFKLTQSDLGDLALSSRENINRALKSWEKDGVIGFDNGYILCANQNKLREIANA